MSGATLYRVVAGAVLKPENVVAQTTGTTATVTPAAGVNDYVVFATLDDGTVKMLPMRVTVIR